MPLVPMCATVSAVMAIAFEQQDVLHNTKVPPCTLQTPYMLVNQHLAFITVVGCCSTARPKSLTTQNRVQHQTQHMLLRRPGDSAASACAAIAGGRCCL